MKYLKDAGIIVPGEIPSHEEEVPLDFTQESSREIGHLQSKFAVRHAHVLFNLARVSADAAGIKRDLRFAKAQFRLRHKKVAVNIANAMMEDDEEIAGLETKLAELEAKEEILDKVASGYAGIRDAASREISRRSSERAQVG